MLKFTVLNGRVVPDPSLLMITEFTNIINYGVKKKKEDLANRMLLYVFFCCDLTDANPLKDVDYRMKQEQANARAFKGGHKFNVTEQNLIDAAVDAYNFFNETALERASLAYDKKIDEIRTLLEDMLPEAHAVYTNCLCENCEETVNIIDKYVSNNKIIADFAKQVNDLSNYKLRTMETAKKIENTGRVRGDKGSSLIERGSFRDKAKI